MRPALRHHLVLTAWTLLIHVLVVLNDGVYWDDWLYLLPDGRHVDWAHILAAFPKSGIPTTNTVYVWLFDAFGYRNVILASVVITGNLFYWLLRFRAFLADHEALAVAMLAVGYPGFECWEIMVAGDYVFCYTAFLGAAALALHAEGLQSRISHAALRILALLLFTLSFNLASLLVLYLAFLACLFAASGPGPKRSSILLAFRLGIRKADFLLAPVLYWIAKQTLFPRSGVYVDYNRFRLSPTVLIAKAGLFLVNGVYRPLNDALLQVIRSPLLALIVLGVGFPLWRIVTSGGRESQVSNRNRLVVFSVLTGLAILPYVAVGHWPLAHGWSTRHSILLGLPVSGLLVVALTISVVATGHRWIRPLGVCTALFGFGSMTVVNHITVQAQWVRDLAMIERLEQLPSGREFSSFIVDDQRTEPRFLSFYEWSSIFRRIWGGESRIGINKRLLGPVVSSTAVRQLIQGYSQYFTEEYNLSRYNADGNVARLAIRDGPGSGLPDWEIAGRYLYGRFVDKAELTKLLVGMTSVDLEPIE
jgi:hypothetical protein